MFYYVEDMMLILLDVIVCRRLECYSVAGSVTLAANGSFAS